MTPYDTVPYMPMAELDTERFCAGCGYDLRGIPSDRCPECGQPFDPNQPTEPQIPWCHRDTLGKRKAFWRTVRLATFHTADFAREITRPVSLADAMAFRRYTVRCTMWPLGLVAAGYYLFGLDLYDKPWYAGDTIGSLAYWIGLPVMLVSLWLFLYFLFGIGSYAFHPSNLPVRQQNRAVALSYYACAPWAYVFVLLFVALANVTVGWFMNVYESSNLIAAAIMILLNVLTVGAWALSIWTVPMRLLARTTHCSLMRHAFIGIVVRPISFVLCAVLTVGVINLAYWLLVLIVLSSKAD